MKGKDWRAGRAASANIIPSSTGAAKAVAKAGRSSRGETLTPLDGRAGRASAAGRPAGRRRPGGETSFPPPGACPSGSLDRPGRNSHRRASREGAFFLEREEIPGPFAPGGAPSQTRPRGASRVSRSGFYRKTLRPDFVSGESRVARRRLRPRRATRSKIVTWLILPVVICL